MVYNIMAVTNLASITTNTLQKEPHSNEIKTMKKDASRSMIKGRLQDFQA
jgi:hypothetical protein